MLEVQKAVYLYEGSINKFLMDDKGSTLIGVFGLPPMSHEDDPIREPETEAVSIERSDENYYRPFEDKHLINLVFN